MNVVAKKWLKENRELRALAREQLKGNWGKAIPAFLLVGIILYIAGEIPKVGSLIVLMISGPFVLGQIGFFTKLKSRENPPISTVFDGFKTYVPSLLLYVLMTVFITLWSLLLIVPGIIAALNYSQAFFIMYDNPEISAMEALKRSKEMMNGQKCKYFLLLLSFIGWSLLACITLGIGFLWLAPYIQTSLVNFYDDIKVR